VRDWLIDVSELGLLVAYFAFVPVVLAVGLYFPFWYSLRQTSRSSVVNSGETEVEGEDSYLYPDDPEKAMLVAWGVLVAGALATAAVLVAIYTVAPNPLAGMPLLYGAVAFYTIFVSIIALPHVVVGGWMDTGRGIWYVP